jgi:hypothetical protein
MKKREEAQEAQSQKGRYVGADDRWSSLCRHQVNGFIFLFFYYLHILASKTTHELPDPADPNEDRERVKE